MEEIELLRKIADEAKNTWDKGWLSLEAARLKNLLTNRIDFNIRHNTESRCPKCGESEPVLCCENCGHRWPRIQKDISGKDHRLLAKYRQALTEAISKPKGILPDGVTLLNGLAVLNDDPLGIVFCPTCRCFDVHAPWCNAGHGEIKGEQP